MKTPSSKDFAYAMLPLKIFSWPVGTWPLQKYNFSSALRSIAAVAVLVIMIAIVNVELYLDTSNAEKNLDGLMLIGCGTLAVSKVVWFRVFPDGLIANFSSAVKDYNELDGKEKRAIVRRHARMARVASAAVVCFSTTAGFMIALVPLIAGDDQATVKADNGTQEAVLDYPIPSDMTMGILNVSGKVYPVILFIECAMLMFTAAGNLGSDGLFFGITFHLCGQAEVLKLEFSKFVDESGNVGDRFNVLTTRHRHLIKLSAKLNDTISYVLVVQLFTSCLLICTSGFQFILSLSVLNVAMLAKTFIVMSTLLMQLFAYSYVGEYLKNQMESIGYSAYCSRWYDIPSKLSRDVAFVLRRAQDPIHLKARQFLVVNMETYMSIVKTSMSYLSILRVMITS